MNETIINQVTNKLRSVDIKKHISEFNTSEGIKDFFLSIYRTEAPSGDEYKEFFLMDSLDNISDDFDRAMTTFTHLLLEYPLHYFNDKGKVLVDATYNSVTLDMLDTVSTYLKENNHEIDTIYADDYVYYQLEELLPDLKFNGIDIKPIFGCAGSILFLNKKDFDLVFSETEEDLPEAKNDILSLGKGDFPPHGELFKVRAFGKFTTGNVFLIKNVQ